MLFFPVDQVVRDAGELGLDEYEEAPAEVKHVTGGAGRSLLLPEHQQPSVTQCFGSLTFRYISGSSNPYL
jgi:hypothetical protein